MGAPSVPRIDYFWPPSGLCRECGGKLLPGARKADHREALHDGRASYQHSGNSREQAGRITARARALVRRYQSVALGLYGCLLRQAAGTTCGRKAFHSPKHCRGEANARRPATTCSAPAGYFAEPGASADSGRGAEAGFAARRSDTGLRRCNESRLARDSSDVPA
jgi:hypothetical protein